MKIAALIFSVFVVGCGTAPTRFGTSSTSEHIAETSVDIATENAQAEFDRAFAAKYEKQPVTAVAQEVVVTERKAQGRTLPKKSTTIVKVVKLRKKDAQPRVEQEEVSPVEEPCGPFRFKAHPPCGSTRSKTTKQVNVALQPRVEQEEVTEVAPPPQRRVAPPESTVPCYLHAPPAVPRGDVIEFRNETQNHVGFRVNGEFVTVVGAIPQPNTRALPYGVALTPSLLPPGTRCYFAMRTAGGSHHIDSVLFRVDPYSGRPQGMGKASDYVTVAYPRSRTYVYAFKNYLY